jgi:ankyrin repeat protein
VLQEVAAARHVVIMCGSIAIDGYAFCLGVKSLQLPYMASPELQTLPSVTYLIEYAGLRSKYTANSPERFSLEIRPLAELIDMFHTRHASDPRDKVYALLGMSLDDPSKATLQPDYTISWEQLFQKLVKYVLGKDTFVDTSSKRPMIKSKGCILGQVSSIGSNDGQNINITFTSKNAAWCFGNKIEWTLRASAKSIQERDIVCLLQGASKPTIIRLHKDFFAIIIIAVTTLKESGSSRQPTLSKSITCFTRHLLLVWDWEQLLKESQDQEESNNWMSFDQATRTWNVALILEDLEEYEKAERRMKKAINGYEMAFEGKLSVLKSQRGLTPLLWAAGNGYDVVVNLLLEEDNIDLDLKDSQCNRTPLSWTAYNGHEAVVKLLLATGQVKVHSKDQDGKTPLSEAAYKGYEAIVKLLLATGQVEVNSKDKWGKTPLLGAAYKGHEAIVKLLLATGQVEVDSKDKRGNTPLSGAAYKGHEAIVKLLLATGQVEVNSKDKGGDTPLSWAAYNGHEAIVKLLLATGQVKVDSKDQEGKTPLSWAAYNGHEAIVKLLLATGQVEANSKDKWSKTPLSWAAYNGHEAIVKLLLATGQVEADSKDKYGETPLAWATKNRHEAIIKLLHGHSS